MGEKLKRILLIEEDINDVELTLEALKQFNFDDKVVVIRDGEEVFDYLLRRKKFSKLPKSKPLVILLDIKMQKINGIEILQKIKKDEKLKRIPIVMVTTSWDDPDLKIAYLYGADAYIVKPVNVVDFMDVMKNIGVYWDMIGEEMAVSEEEIAG